jgi:hypothetical protein
MRAESIEAKNWMNISLNFQLVISLGISYSRARAPPRRHTIGALFDATGLPRA